jgi:pantoate--beta-alanine ligase
MGALHLGHIKLIQKAKKRNAIRIVSIFVNPSQFGPSEDFINYPRSIHNDLNLLRNEDVDIVFLPIENEILKYKTFYKCPNFKIENILCGKSRPNYFPGVKNIVIKLFDIVQADNSFFGEKDYQQLVVIKKLRDELSFGTKIIPIKTVRNKNGLPLSSRNKYLEINEIEIANKINKICKYLIPKVKNKLNTTKILAHAKRELRMNGIDKIDYLTILTDTLEKRRSLKSKSRIFIAANVGSTRLIDNFPI